MINSPVKTQRSKLLLSIACVTYKPNAVILSKVLQDLMDACERLEGFDTNLFLIDNGPSEEDLRVLQKITRCLSPKFSTSISLITGQGNVGFGKAHNLVLRKSESDFHLIINPDIYVEKKTLLIGLEYLLANRDVVLVAPAARFLNGEVQFISKRYPGLLLLSLRGFAPTYIRRCFNISNSNYEYRDLIPSNKPVEVDLASGCFMMVRMSALKEIIGFDETFFMYFEDFDLSIRLRATGGKIVHLPEMKVTHLGGNSAKKGIKHIHYFIVSAIKFFNKHGWKFF
ncbi:MAG: glycosyltransferase [Pseudomonadales bacterium]|nr:glycosyltransferase [Pseudomonadales bacterium]